MNWNDWEMIWKRQELPRGADADLAELRRTFEARSGKLARTLLVRNVSEAGAGLFVAAVFASVGFRLKTAWPMALAVGLILAVTAFFIWEMIRARRGRLGAEAPLLAKLDADIAELRHQRRLLLSLRIWYLTPIAVAMLLVGAAVALNNPASVLLLKEPLILFSLMFYVLLCVLLFWGVWVLNRRAVRKQIDPRLQELEKLRNDLFVSS
jgi:hypothetical protein